MWDVEQTCIMGMWLNRGKGSRYVTACMIKGYNGCLWLVKQMNGCKMHFEILLNSESWTLDQIG